MKSIIIFILFTSLSHAQILDTSYEGQTLYSKYLALTKMNLDVELSFETVPQSANATLKEKVANLAIETANLKEGFSRANWKSDQFGKLFTSINNRIFEMKTILSPTNDSTNLWLEPKPLSEVKSEFSSELGFPVDDLMSFEIKLGKVLLRDAEVSKKLDKTLEMAKDLIKKPITKQNLEELLTDLSQDLTDCDSQNIKVDNDQLTFELLEVNEGVTTQVTVADFNDQEFMLEKLNLHGHLYGYKISPKSPETSPIKYIRFSYGKNNKLNSAHFELNIAESPYIYCNEYEDASSVYYWDQTP